MDARDARDPTLPLPVARGLAFFLLAGFAVLHWMALLQPGVPGRGALALLIALGVAVALWSARALPGRYPQLAGVVIAVVALVLAMLAGGMPRTLLHPSHWDELASGITRGIQGLPGVRVPYRGFDPWIRLVIPVGATALVAVAALAAFWPRRAGRLGVPGLALLLLVVLYAVPTVTLAFAGEFLRGAVLAMLVLAFLRLERLRVRDVRLAGAVAGVVIVGGLLIAPLINSDTPWFDYEAWALDASTSKTTAYSWNHTYGPLHWPRDGREMLRVRAKRPAYWKAENLTTFDGRHWVHGDDGFSTDISTPQDPEAVDRWTENIRVTVQNLRTNRFITGGYAFDVNSPGDLTTMEGDGTFGAPRTLQRGDAYTAQIYSPQPTEEERHAAPPADDRIVWPYLRVYLPQKPPLPVNPVVDQLLYFPSYGSGQLPVAAKDGTTAGSYATARDVLTRGPYAGVWKLVGRLKRGTHDQEDYVAKVLRYLGGAAFSYTESPPPAAENLAGFLLKAKTGYCQQYSGAMALLLRMGGVPARVSTGFTSGALDRRANEYVVRDLDAHSWVEVWYSGIGWVTFDPTPAAAPPRNQPDEATGTGPSGRPASAPLLPGDKGGTRIRAAAVADPAPWWRIPLLVVVGLLAVAAAAWAVWRIRRPAPPAVDELERALRRTGRGGAPGTTLSALESAFARTPAAAAYIRAIQDARYAGHTAEPTRSQRRALRTELGRGHGVGGRLRAWWALPPL